MYWNKEIMPRNDGKYPKKPDITVINMNNHEAQLYDVTIVADCNIKKAYIEKTMITQTFSCLFLSVRQGVNIARLYVPILSVLKST